MRSSQAFLQASVFFLLGALGVRLSQGILTMQKNGKNREAPDRLLGLFLPQLPCTLAPLSLSFFFHFETDSQIFV